MELLTLYTGLLLPWLGGTLWLAFVDSQFAPHNHHSRLRQAGYGFFLGYAVLFIAIMAINALTGTASWLALIAFMAAFAGSGGIAVWLSPGVSTPAPQLVHGPKSTAAKLLTALISLWMTVHLVFVAIDIFTQPVYPWDAWLAWVYRAKAWYFAGGINAIVSPAEWASASTANIYSIDAWKYPLFPSTIPYWSALSLGRWSETLVNLPVLFGGAALGMGLYGQCREHGMGVSASLVCCYLLFSIPLFATHLSLAGYADIWMAGYTGLGFIAVIRATFIRGTTSKGDVELSDNGKNDGTQMALGLLFLACG